MDIVDGAPEDHNQQNVWFCGSLWKEESQFLLSFFARLIIFIASFVMVIQTYQQGTENFFQNLCALTAGTFITGLKDGKRQ